MEFGKRLKDLRNKTGLSQEELACLINERLGKGTKRNSSSNYENNRTRPDYETLIALSDFYHITVDQILKTDDDTFSEIVSVLNEDN